MLTDHEVYTYPEDEKEMCHWECSCGHGGTAPGYVVDERSDRHIDYDSGDTRKDLNKPKW